MACKCGLDYDECRFPISHSHPTINNVKLSGPVARIFRNRDTRGYTTLQEYGVLNNTRVHESDYVTI